MTEKFRNLDSLSKSHQFWLLFVMDSGYMACFSYELGDQKSLDKEILRLSYEGKSFRLVKAFNTTPEIKIDYSHKPATRGLGFPPESQAWPDVPGA
jgi:hypothetical protein